MKFLIDLLPVVVLFVIFKLTKDMFMATGGAMAASVIQMAILKLIKQPIKAIHWFSLASILILGGLSIYFHDTLYLKWKFTIVEWVLGLTILVGQYGFKKNMLQALMGSELALPEVAWHKLALSYATFFIAIGALNLYVAYHYDDNAWLNFKMYWTTGLLIVFVVGQSLWMAKYLTDDTDADQKPTSKQ